jgi:predicted nucleic acid-binding protein
MIVSNTSPLIALAKADALFLLKALFAEVRIPSAVHRELLAKSGVEAARLDAALADFIMVVACPKTSLAVEEATKNTGAGEQQAIILADALSALLLIDEHTGRKVARHLHIPVTGAVGVLIKARQSGLISKVLPLVIEMRRNGYWLADRLLEIVAKLDDQ